jgi:dachs protein
MFGIRHFTGRVVYNASNFLPTNQDLLPDDVVCVFSRNNCNFGFVSYLFAAEISSSMGRSTCIHSEPIVSKHPFLN